MTPSGGLVRRRGTGFQTRQEKRLHFRDLDIDKDLPVSW